MQTCVVIELTGSSIMYAEPVAIMKIDLEENKKAPSIFISIL